MKNNKRRFTTPIQVSVFDHSKLILDRVFEEYPVVIGRSPRAEISFPQFDFISKQHAAIVESKGETFIVDLNSSNGLYFQGKKSRKAPVTEDGIISIGALTLRFRILASSTMAVGDDATIALQKPVQSPVEPQVEPKKEPSPFQNSVQSNLGEIQKPKKPTIPVAEKSEVDTDATLVSVKPAIPIKPRIKANKPEQRSKAEHHHHAIVDGIALVEPYPHAKNIRPDQRVLEAFVTWKGSVFDTQQFYPGDKVTVGRGHGVGLNVPTLTKRVDLAFFDGQKTQCFVPQGAQLKVRNSQMSLSFEDLMKSQAIGKWQNGYLLKLGNEELASFDIGPEIEVHFRYIPATRPLTRKKVIEPEEEIRKTTLLSGLFHGLIIAIALLNAPEARGPKIPNVPERYARLLVEPPKTIVEKKPEPPKPPEPEPEPPKQAERPKPKPEKKIVKRIIQKKPKPVVMKPSPVLKQASNVPPNPKATSQSVSKNPAPVNVNTLGALSALTAVSNAPPSSQPVSININQNAGGPSKFTTTGVLGALKTSGGKLQAGGVQSVQTRGLGVGTGTGYGIQGIKGTAGSRGVAGGIIGSPQIMSVSAQEGLTRAQVMAVVKKHLGEIQQCYERSLFQAPSLAGKVEYEWDIQPTGSVSAVKVKASQMTGADAMNSCVFAVFRKMRFPTAKNGMMTVPSIPLEFGKL